MEFDWVTKLNKHIPLGEPLDVILKAYDVGHRTVRLEVRRSDSFIGTVRISHASYLNCGTRMNGVTVQFSTVTNPSVFPPELKALYVGHAPPRIYLTSLIDLDQTHLIASEIAPEFSETSERYDDDILWIGGPTLSDLV